MRRKIIYTHSKKSIHKTNAADKLTGYFHQWVQYKGNEYEHIRALIETSEGRILQISSKFLMFIEPPPSSPGDLLKIELKLNALVCRMNGMIAVNRECKHNKEAPQFLLKDFDDSGREFERLVKELEDGAED